MSAEFEEISSLQLEFQWLLNEEVNLILYQLQQLISECSKRFFDQESKRPLVKTEKIAFNSINPSHQERLKASASLTGDDITHAEITVRLPKHSSNSLKFTIIGDCVWKLNQIQDASNHLMAAMSLLTAPPMRFDEQESKFNFQSAEEVIQVIDDIMGCLKRGRNSLVVPKTKTIEELRNSRNMKTLQPSVPNDLAISFYVQSHKLVCAVYHQIKDQVGNVKLDIFQAEASIPWLSEALVLFTVALQFCQQLKDKVSVFSQYKEMQVRMRP
ncbi:rogdi atypical leucine zipper [Brevipalpus obovatus]|uniref:rogdi atypical leucine zipper n=1 Tax=Brevipalpus obovatus TaxID=246614 RepID=UPI003D9F557E